MNGALNAERARLHREDASGWRRGVILLTLKPQPTKKLRPIARGRLAAAIEFKHPVDCDDEESLEERRGRTVLRTAM